MPLYSARVYPETTHSKNKITWSMVMMVLLVILEPVIEDVLRWLCRACVLLLSKKYATSLFLSTTFA